MTWRPRNETDEDLQNEAEIINAVADYLGNLKWVKLSESLYEIDAALFDSLGMLQAWCEAKMRAKTYDPVLLSFAKIMALYRWQSCSETSVYFAMRTPDGTYLHRVKRPTEYRIQLAGNDRGQNGDKEPCAMIPLNEFSLIAPP